jgi:hypothetical protein
MLNSKIWLWTDSEVSSGTVTSTSATYKYKDTCHRDTHQRDVRHKSTSPKQRKQLFQGVILFRHHAEHRDQGRTEGDEQRPCEGGWREVFPQQDPRENGIPEERDGA